MVLFPHKNSVADSKPNQFAGSGSKKKTPTGSEYCFVHKIVIQKPYKLLRYSIESGSELDLFGSAI